MTEEEIRELARKDFIKFNGKWDCYGPADATQVFNFMRHSHLVAFERGYNQGRASVLDKWPSKIELNKKLRLTSPQWSCGGEDVYEWLREKLGVV
jgi:hypothetical protein